MRCCQPNSGYLSSPEKKKTWKETWAKSWDTLCPAYRFPFLLFLPLLQKIIAVHFSKDFLFLKWTPFFCSFTSRLHDERKKREESSLCQSFSSFLFFSPSLQEWSKVQVGEKGHSSSSSLFFRGASSIPFFSFFLSEKCIHPSLSIFFSYTALSSRWKKGKGNFFSSSFSFPLNSAKIFWSGLISA